MLIQHLKYISKKYQSNDTSVCNVLNTSISLRKYRVRADSHTSKITILHEIVFFRISELNGHVATCSTGAYLGLNILKISWGNSTPEER